MAQIRALSKRDIIGPEHPLYQGGKTHDGSGYIVLSSKEWGEDIKRREHCVVMERKIGRTILAGEIVHHIDGNKANNDPDNLSLETRASHNRMHGRGRELMCLVCGTGRWYSPGLIARMANPEGYKCRTCRFGKTWDNGRKKK